MSQLADEAIECMYEAAEQRWDLFRTENPDIIIDDECARAAFLCGFYDGFSGGIVFMGEKK